MELLIIAVWFTAGLLGLSMAIEGESPALRVLGKYVFLVWAGFSMAWLIYSGLVLSGAI